MKRISKLFIFLLLPVLFCSGCSSADTSSVWSLSEKCDQLLNEISYSDTLSEMDDSLFSYLYPEIAPEDIKEKIIYISSGATAEEIAGFEAVDADAAKRIETGLQARIDSQTESFTDYNPEEVKRLGGAVLVRHENIVILCVSSDPATVEKILK